MVLLCAFNTQTGKEIRYDELLKTNWRYLFGLAKRYDQYNIDQLVDQDIDNFEGYVVRFESGFRMKIKLETYLKIHKIVTNVSTKTVWEMLKDGKDIESMISNVPDEFYDWFKQTVNKLNDGYQEIELNALREFKDIIFELCNNKLPQKFFNKKEFALKAKKSKYSHILFCFFDGKEYDQSIWMMLKPKTTSLFKNNLIEEN